MGLTFRYMSPPMKIFIKEAVILFGAHYQMLGLKVKTNEL